MIGSFFSDLLSGDLTALLIVAVVLGVVAYFWQTEVKKAKDRAEIAQHNAVAETADLEGRFAKRDIHPTAAPLITQTRELTRIELDADRERMETGLHGGNQELLTPHALIETLHARLNHLYDVRDAEKHPDKRAILETRITQLKEELRARGDEAVVRAGGRSVLGSADTDANESGGVNAGPQTEPEPVPAPKARVGF